MTNREAFEAAMTKLAEQPEDAFEKPYPDDDVNAHWAVWRAAEASAIERCLKIVETYEVSVGNSAAGEIACEMTMANLREIRDEMRGLRGST
ncbi:hypothetical protein SAMN05216466_107155 [Paraburkholderia phenazinium]|uniref:Uncharacterized protein n=1 Tax=Paraburkholderia phenazinium TaxID=60549 RepID=A0A1G7ZSE9_9BURK|nr:hypothetical protein [Paraburkholderia phenazinium]SDH11604.1 hypothetical protein SAMN05216466_107155 [Paraburkholderia phenazinium]